jgi:hypothetical protein
MPNRDDPAVPIRPRYLLWTPSVQLSKSVQLICRPTLREECRAENDDPCLGREQPAIDTTAETISWAKGDLVVPHPESSGFKRLGECMYEIFFIFVGMRYKDIKLGIASTGIRRHAYEVYLKPRICASNKIGH